MSVDIVDIILKNWSCPAQFRIQIFPALSVSRTNRKSNYLHQQSRSGPPLNQHARNQTVPLRLTLDLDEQIKTTVVAMTIQ